MSIAEMKQKLAQMKQEIRERHTTGDESDELVQKVVEATRLAREISERWNEDA